jgi:TatD DNase family protein
MLIDALAHLTDPRVTELDPILGRARDAGVTTIISAGTDPLSASEHAPIDSHSPVVKRAFGLHPANVDSSLLPAQLAALERLLENPEVVALGEIGVDRRDGMPPVDAQLAAFTAQLELAHQGEWPIILHSVAAVGITLTELQRHGQLVAGGIWHGFTGPADIIEKLQTLNLSVSFGTLVTQAHAGRCRIAAARTPLSQLLVESDCPDHPTPKSESGMGEPSGLIEIIETLAELRSESYEEIAVATADNARRLYRLR